MVPRTFLSTPVKGNRLRLALFSCLALTVILSLWVLSPPRPPTPLRLEPEPAPAIRPLLADLHKESAWTGERFIQEGRRIQALARTLPDRPSIVRGLEWEAHGTYLCGAIEAASAQYQKALILARSIPYPEGEARCLLEQGNLSYFCRQDYPEALTLYASALAVYRSISQLAGQARCLNNMGDISCKAGRYPQAVSLFSEALSLSEATGLPSARDTIRSNLTAALIRFGDLETARRHLNQLQVRARQRHDLVLMRKIASLESQWHARQGKYQQALDGALLAMTYHQKLRDRLHPPSFARIAFTLHQLAGRAHLALGNLPAARREAQQMDQLTTREQDPYDDARGHLFRAHLAQAEGNDSSAFTQAGLALSLSSRGRFTQETRTALSLLEDLALARGEAKPAAQYRARLRALEEQFPADRVGARIMAILADEEQARRSRSLSRWQSMIRRSLLPLLGLALLGVLATIRALQLLRQNSRDREQNMNRLASDLNKTLNHRPKPAPKVPPLEEEEIRYRTSSLSSSDAQAILERLLTLLQKEELWRDSEVTLESVAELLNCNRTYLSQAVNQSWEGKFTDLLNAFRVNAVEQALWSGQWKGTLLDLALEAGFQSKSSFNRVFKTRTGLTPKEYRALLDAIRNTGPQGGEGA